MVGIDAYLFGYRLIYPEEGGEARLATALLKLGIVAEGRRGGAFLIREADYCAFCSYAGGRVRYTATEIRGLPALLLALRSNLATVITGVFSLFLVIFLSHLVWDVRIEGNERISAELIAEKLDDAGIGVGTVWDKADIEAAEAALLDAMPDLAWVQINRVGTVAEVIIRERAPTAKPQVSPYSASNIVASEDGVIEEITVHSGTALVAAGDVVRKGDVLISGVVETERGNYLTTASGTVIAHTAGSIEVSAGRRETERESKPDGTESLSISIFGLKINIFKNYGNYGSDCAIIENEVDYLFVLGRRLPVAIVRERRYVSEEREVTYDPSELPMLASDRLESSLRDTLGKADLIKLKTVGKYTEEGYVLLADYVISKEIGEESEIPVGD